VDVMPGLRDPSNVAMPQQRLHPCLFPRSSGFRDTFNLVTNPYKCTVGDKKDASSVCITGHAGQPVADIARFSSLSDPLDALERTLVWQHLAPTAPDTLACYPFKNNDPFVIHGRCPDVLFTGNAPAFDTRTVTLSNGHTVRLIAVPRFSTTGTVALLDLATKEVTSLSIHIDSALSGVEEDGAAPMDVDSSEAP
jgi:DNA polymerase delta subunit 2